MIFRVGQKVVCVDVRGLASVARVWNVPRQDGVYTVREVFTTRAGNPAILLVEIVNAAGRFPSNEFGEARFHARRFRPVVDKKTDIGFAHEILRKASRTKEAAA